MSPRARSAGAIVAIILTLLAAVLLVWWGTPASARHATREALRSTFESDTRNLVYRWDDADPRSEPERRAALFDFIYQTYDSSAWIPQSLFDSNLVTQAVIGDVDTIVGEKVGLVLWRDQSVVPAYGMAPDDRADLPLRWTVNCLVCHTAEIDGVAYLGAGTKTFDDRWLGEALKTLTSERWRSVSGGSAEDLAVAADANRILTSHHHDKIDSLTRARSTAFAASHVELFMRPNGAMPPVADVGRGDTKTPPLWHTAAKMPSGRWYVDGSFHGGFPLMASSMELEKDRPFDALVESVIPTIKEEFTFRDSTSSAAAVPLRDRPDARGAWQGALLLPRGWVCALPWGLRRPRQCRVARRPQGRRHRSRAPRRRVGQVHRRVRAEPAGRRGLARQEPRLRRDTVDRCLGELPVSAQRERADAVSSARSSLRTAGGV